MLPITGWAWRSSVAIQSFACLRFRQRGRSASHVRAAACRKVGGLARRFAASGSPPERASRRFSNAWARASARVTSRKPPNPRSWRRPRIRARCVKNPTPGTGFTSAVPQTQSNSARFVALRATVPTGGRRSLASAPLALFDARRDGSQSRGLAFSLPPAYGGLCRDFSGGRRSLASGPSGWLWSGPVEVVEAAGIEPASESLLQRRLHAYPGCGREPAPGGAFPSFGPAPHQPGESRLGTYPWCSPTARENRRQSPPRSTSFPARQTWSGRTWLLKQPVPVQCWLLFCFHRLREVDPRHAVVASCTFVEPSTPPPRAIWAALPRLRTNRRS